jgi:HpcH/HpaI aldolase/citrate lyase family
MMSANFVLHGRSKRRDGSSAKNEERGNRRGETGFKVAKADRDLEGAPMAFPKSQKSILSLKSLLFTPGTKSDRFDRAAGVHADALIIDLEEAVAPSAKKQK